MSQIGDFMAALPVSFDPLILSILSPAKAVWTEVPALDAFTPGCQAPLSLALCRFPMEN
jgi:hypothetical protein